MLLIIHLLYRIRQLLGRERKCYRIKTFFKIETPDIFPFQHSSSSTNCSQVSIYASVENTLISNQSYNFVPKKLNDPRASAEVSVSVLPFQRQRLCAKKNWRRDEVVVLGPFLEKPFNDLHFPRVIEQRFRCRIF